MNRLELTFSMKFLSPRFYCIQTLKKRNKSHGGSRIPRLLRPPPSDFPDNLIIFFMFFLFFHFDTWIIKRFMPQYCLIISLVN